MPGCLRSYKVLMFIMAIGLMRNAFAQTTPAGAIADASATLRSNYYQQTARQLRLYNGIKYVEYNAYYTGNPCFNINSFQNTTLYYDGSKFENTPALYDMYREMVVVKYADTTEKISLINIRLDSFNMSGYKFIRIDAANIKPGFYQLLYDGKTQLLKKYAVATEDDRSGAVVRHQFYQSSTYYVLKNGMYNNVSGGRALLSQLKDKRKQLNEYLKANKIDNRLAEEDMIRLLLYYDKLNG